ncbi:MAG: aspartate--tRNA ligase [Armatimonadota bacterium]|nr:aspartate--tRNA ligase [Armatimonadota bacterium]MDR7532376.1 aspartate--tRNA ligase [Armatimonadota bacterium]MDR7535303.1 aspartate--tRNA ligase [Armatimonadota bacterium]
MRTALRSHMCGELRPAHAGQRVRLAGWVQRRRDLGGLIFLDLRDREGVVQVVVDPRAAPDAGVTAGTVRSEYVVGVEGVVARRPAGTENRRLPTGDVEVRAEALRVLAPSLVPPFAPGDDGGVDEAVRLRYRFLDLRRPRMYRNLLLRHRVALATRRVLDRLGFLEVETPMLIRSTPEGARDFLVPSRLHRGHFYALPQSPQLFKQLLMVAGIDRYFQIVRCFRDEDLRADRQPEFTQIDLEMSFVSQDDVLAVTEEMVAAVVEEAAGVRVARPFPRLSYAEAVRRYGTDKPDLRIGVEIVDLTDLAAAGGVERFRAAVSAGGVVRGLRAAGLAGVTRREVEAWGAVATAAGLEGLATVALGPAGPRGALARHMGPGELEALRVRFGAGDGDLLLVAAGPEARVAAALGRLRLLVAERGGWQPEPTELRFAWILEFPLLEYSPEERRHVAVHHPFTAPLDEDRPLLDTAPARVRAKAHDLVLNGLEVAGGSIRIHERSLQERLFALLGITPEEARARFGFLLDALQYGAPPHGGIAFGLDRFVMALAGEHTIREVIAFPKTASAVDLLTGAPSPVDASVLRELHLAVTNGGA